MRQEFLNREEVFEKVKELYEGVCEDFGCPNTFDSLVEEYAHITADSIVNDMRKYVHQKDHSIVGNFNNISRDYEYIEKRGDFSEVVRKIDAGEMNEKELAEFQVWCLGWFFETFGTFGITYNFGDMVSDWLFEEERNAEIA